MKQNMTRSQIQREIDATEQQIEQTGSIYRKRDLTRHLRRLQKQRHLIDEQQKQDCKRFQKGLYN